jgi:hypothetical protein
MGQLGEVGLGVAQAAQNALALGGCERPGDFCKARRAAPRKAGDVLEVMGQGFGRAHWWRRLALRAEAFEKEHRVGEKSLACRFACRAPGGVEPGDFAAGESVLGRTAGQAKAGLSVAVHQRHQILHRRARRDLAGSQELLNLGR